MTTILNRTQAALASTVSLRAVLTVAVSGLVILPLAAWVAVGQKDKQDAMRWAKGGDLQETVAFAKAVTHSQTDLAQYDLGHWQSAPLNPTLAGKRSYALPRVSVYTVPNIHPVQPQPTLRDLSDRAQVRAIDAIEHAAGSKIHPWNDLRKTLSDEEEPGEKDPFLFERVLVVTVTKGIKAPPGDRLTWTRVFVEPINFKFAAYTIAATENETVKVSSVEATKVRKLSADFGLGIPGIEGSKIGLAPSNETSVKTTSDISTQYEQLGVDITPGFMRIIRESAAGHDAVGNTRIALSITTDPNLLLHKNTGNPLAPRMNLVVTAAHLEDDGTEPTMQVLPLVPLPHCALKAKVSAIYEQRHIQSGNEFYDESRQTVTFIHDVDDEGSVQVMGADDVSPFVWSIQVLPPGAQPGQLDVNRTLRAKFSGRDGVWRPLVFSDYGRAAKLAHWVRTHRGRKLSGYEFQWGEDEGLFVVKQTSDECDDEETPSQQAPNIPAEAEHPGWDGSARPRSR